MKNNKKVIAIVVALVAVLAVAIVLYMLVGQKEAKDDMNGSQDQSKSTSKVDASKTFKPQELKDIPYTETSTTTVGGETTVTKTENDGKGNIKTSSTGSGLAIEVYTIGDQTYTCMSGKCEVVTSAEPEAPVDLSGLEDYKNDTETYSGRADCPAGTCDKWVVKTKEGMELTYYIDGSNRISKVTTSASGVETTIEYTYKPVTVTAPKV